MDTLNGHPVIGSFTLPKKRDVRDGRIVLVDKGDSSQHSRYVTAWQGFGDEGWCQGHYFSDLTKALDNFVARVKVHI